MSMSFDEKALEIPETLPMLPVRDIVIFPYMILPLFVGRESSIKAVEEALAKNRLIFLASQKELTDENLLAFASNQLLPLQKKVNSRQTKSSVFGCKLLHSTL
jgi:ATP-dependent Lon protease